MPLDYGRAPASAGERLWRVFVLSLLVAVLILFVLSLIYSELGRRNTERANRIQCALNLRQVAMAVAMYANNHVGRFPDDLESIMAEGGLSPDAFVCPNSGDTPAPDMPTTQATAAGLRQPGHCSYIYLGKGLTDRTVTPDMVLAYEPLTNHGGTGMNVLFGDFHVEWLAAADAQTILRQVAVRKRKTPVRYPATAPAIEPAAGRTN